MDAAQRTIAPLLHDETHGLQRGHVGGGVTIDCDQVGARSSLHGRCRRAAALPP
ncbi:hypothetical protein [Pseudoduganella chitinolytica]|uniref:Uncharacterized protein n=1 Tax=Pseudoduganella chitinolytica TaxID=34070 RepID=A0ABY8BI35_9BURK|nr:hypothetical protein [Pseudoduganella chitinolytica]WEF35013.1 hypothetical protein PX653_09700 [Pseudoduganella chitinolytica]